ncbi:MAG TPA: TonB family protein [Candidatus Baltobacteraceae bacterium]|nr:TonB family protein [Candidatus Baltobacteraceae bacterium]
MIPRLILFYAASMVLLLTAPAEIAAQQRSPVPGGSCAQPNRPAQVVTAVIPDYPDAVAQLHLKATTATVGVETDATGAVTSVWIAVSSGNDDLDHAALDAARKSKFAPALVNCIAVASSFGVQEDFVPESAVVPYTVMTPSAPVVRKPFFTPPRGWKPFTPTGTPDPNWQFFASWYLARSSLFLEGGATTDTVDSFHQRVERDLIATGARIITDRAVLTCKGTQTGWLLVYTIRDLGYAEITAFAPSAEYDVTYETYDRVPPSDDVMASLTSLCTP